MSASSTEMFCGAATVGERARSLSSLVLRSIAANKYAFKNPPPSVYYLRRGRNGDYSEYTDKSARLYCYEKFKFVRSQIACAFTRFANNHLATSLTVGRFHDRTFRQRNSRSYVAGSLRGKPVDKDSTDTECAVHSSDENNENSTPNAGEPPNGPYLQLFSGGYLLPHPAKKSKGGEDAYFINDDFSAVGVADGVGGWSELGVDAGMYSRLLMSEAHKACTTTAPTNLLGVLSQAHGKSQVQGSSTACIVRLVRDDAAPEESGKYRCQGINLGDSGFVIVRDGEVAFKSSPQQHGFNFPFQLGFDEVHDLPESADEYAVPVNAGDTIVVGTDGLFDNVFDEEIAHLVTNSRKKGNGPESLAKELAITAQNMGIDFQRRSPFSVAAEEAGFEYRGGKLDDVTVVVSFVDETNRK